MRRLIGAVATGALLVGLPTTAKAADSDWVMIVVEAGSSGAAGVLLSIDGDARLTGSGPAAGGVAFALEGNSNAFVLGLGATGVAVTSSDELGSVHVNVAPPMDDHFEFHLSLELDLMLEPGESTALLGFFPNTRILDASTSAVADAGTINSRFEAGSGSTAYVVSEPRQPGPSASLGPTGAGVLQRTTEAAAGLVGAFNLRACQGVCRGSWESPIKSGEYVETYPHAIFGAGLTLGSEWFSGPAGSWRWNWVGSTLADEAPIGSLLAPPIIAAWAPIGDDHLLFVPTERRLV